MCIFVFIYFILLLSQLVVNIHSSHIYITVAYCKSNCQKSQIYIYIYISYTLIIPPRLSSHLPDPADSAQTRLGCPPTSQTLLTAPRPASAVLTPPRL